jgi:uncharacterized membrane protein YgcG
MIKKASSPYLYQLLSQQQVQAQCITKMLCRTQSVSYATRQAMRNRPLMMVAAGTMFTANMMMMNYRSFSNMHILHASNSGNNQPQGGGGPSDGGSGGGNHN